MRFQEFISELGDSPAEHEPNRRRRRSLFHATVDGQWVDVFFDRSDLNGTLHITFTVNSKYDAPEQPTSASASTVRILSTVLSIIRQRLPEYIRSARPPAVSFTAREDSRTRLYRKYFVPVVQEILGPRWKLTEFPSMGMTVFNWRPVKKKEVTEGVRAYHGNQGGIDTEQLHTPMWFTASRPDAEYYAGDDGYVVVVDLDIKNPYRLRAGEEANTVLRRWQELQAQGYDGIHDRRLGDWIPFTRDQIHVISKDDTFVGENFSDGRPVIDMLEEGCIELSRMLEERPHLIENYEGWAEIQSLLNRIVGEDPVIGQHYSVLNLTIIPPGRFLVQQGIRTPVKLTNILDRGSYVQYEFDVSGRIFRFPEDHRAGDRLSRTFLYLTPRELEKTQSFIAMSLRDWEIRDRINENFADGKVKGKSRPGRVKRAGASCKGSVTDLRARAKKYGGERGKMYHWCANMKSGRQKK